MSAFFQAILRFFLGGKRAVVSTPNEKTPAKPIASGEFPALRSAVKNRGTAPATFLAELVRWARKADDFLFAENAAADIYTSVAAALGPYRDLRHRKAVMLEVLRVLAGFESSWNWSEGVDTTNPTSNRPETEEAGAWQVSMNAIAFGEDLRAMTRAKIGGSDYSLGAKFQNATKTDRAFAIEFIVRLLRHTTAHNGPAKRHEIDEYLRRDAVAEFERLLA